MKCDRASSSGSRGRLVPLLGWIVAASLLLGFMPTSSDAAFRGRNGRIAFSNGRHIYSIKPDGTGLRRLTSGRGWNKTPSWSPDGRRIAYTCNTSNYAHQRGDICIMRADGSGRRRVTRGDAVDVTPGWAPGGGRLVFARLIHDTGCPAPLGASSDPNYEIFSIRRDGTGLRRLTCSPGIDWLPSWSPSGDKIAFDSFRSGQESVWTMSPDGSDLSEVTSDGGGSAADWSPSGERIAFSRFGEGGATGSWHLHMVRRDGTEVERLSRTNAGSGGTPAFAPNGRRLVFADLRDHDVTALYTIRRDGTGRKLLFYNGKWVEGPDWQPRP